MQLMKIMIHPLAFVLRHFLIVVLAIIAGCILWTITYLILLLFAIIGNQGLGGPLAYPAGIIAVILVCTVIGWGIFAPASGIGVLFCKAFNLPRLFAIPVVFLSACLLSSVLQWSFIQDAPTASMWVTMFYHVMILSLPLGIYWWLTEGPGALLDMLRRWIKRRRNHTHITPAGDSPSARTNPDGGPSAE